MRYTIVQFSQDFSFLLNASATATLNHFFSISHSNNFWAPRPGACNRLARARRYCGNGTKIETATRSQSCSSTASASTRGKMSREFRNNEESRPDSCQFKKIPYRLLHRRKSARCASSVTPLLDPYALWTTLRHIF